MENFKVSCEALRWQADEFERSAARLRQAWDDLLRLRSSLAYMDNLDTDMARDLAALAEDMERHIHILQDKSRVLRDIAHIYAQAERRALDNCNALPAHMPIYMRSETFRFTETATVNSETIHPDWLMAMAMLDGME